LFIWYLYNLMSVIFITFIFISPYLVFLYMDYIYLDIVHYCLFIYWMRICYLLLFIIADIFVNKTVDILKSFIVTIFVIYQHSKLTNHMFSYIIQSMRVFDNSNFLVTNGFIFFSKRLFGYMLSVILKICY
jgi:hypothetical protein